MATALCPGLGTEMPMVAEPPSRRLVGRTALHGRYGVYALRIDHLCQVSCVARVPLQCRDLATGESLRRVGAFCAARSLGIAQDAGRDAGASQLDKSETSGSPDASCEENTPSLLASARGAGRLREYRIARDCWPGSGSSKATRLFSQEDSPRQREPSGIRKVGRPATAVAAGVNDDSPRGRLAIRGDLGSRPSARRSHVICSPVAHALRLQDQRGRRTPDAVADSEETQLLSAACDDIPNLVGVLSPGPAFIVVIVARASAETDSWNQWGARVLVAPATRGTLATAAAWMRGIQANGITQGGMFDGYARVAVGRVGVVHLRDAVKTVTQGLLRACPECHYSPDRSGGPTKHAAPLAFEFQASQGGGAEGTTLHLASAAVPALCYPFENAEVGNPHVPLRLGRRIHELRAAGSATVEARRKGVSCRVPSRVGDPADAVDVAIVCRSGEVPRVMARGARSSNRTLMCRIARIGVSEGELCLGALMSRHMSRTTRAVPVRARQRVADDRSVAPGRERGASPLIRVPLLMRQAVVGVVERAGGSAHSTTLAVIE